MKIKLFYLIVLITILEDNSETLNRLLGMLLYYCYLLREGLWKEKFYLYCLKRNLIYESGIVQRYLLHVVLLLFYCPLLCAVHHFLIKFL